MNTFTKLEQFYFEAKGNKWFRWFAVFCRVILALGFLPSGIVKIMGERFASGLSVNNPMGHYLEALHTTGYYYTFIGIAQVTIAVLLLIPRTALLGAILYFPVILNICVLTYSTRFEGTRITTLMLLANLYLLCWDLDRLKHIFFKQATPVTYTTKNNPAGNKFPFIFFGGVFATAATVIIVNQFMYDIRPGNSFLECSNGCIEGKNTNACQFCDCIYKDGKPLNKCLEEFKQRKERQKNDSLRARTETR